MSSNAKSFSEMDPDLYDKCVDVLNEAGFYENVPCEFIRDGVNVDDWCIVKLDKPEVMVSFSNCHTLYVVPSALIEVLGGMCYEEIYEEKAVSFSRDDQIVVTKQEIDKIIDSMPKED